MKEVLVVEDNPEIKLLIADSLNEYLLTFCSTLQEASLKLKIKKFNLILLDLGLPDGDGFQLLSEVSGQAQTRELPVIILSGKSKTLNKVMAFSLGAEDFVSKPFDSLELRARVQAKIKKTEKNRDQLEHLQVGDLRIDILKQKVQIEQVAKMFEVDLTSLEFKLLLTLVKSPERIFSREYLLHTVWGYAVHVADRTVDAHVGHLRKKLTSSRTKIETVIGEGYRFLTLSK